MCVEKGQAGRVKQNEAGKILVLEGIDGCGKSTQFYKLTTKLQKRGIAFETDSFPNYTEESSFFVRRYLAGGFGEGLSAPNARLASTFYGLDRYASYTERPWGSTYRAGGNVLFSRYISSNAIFQGTRLSPGETIESFIDWLYDYELNFLGIPPATKTCLLNMPPRVAAMLRAQRGGTSMGGGGKDIHEDNLGFLESCHSTSLYLAHLFGWPIIDCVKDGDLRSVESISDELFDIALSLFGA